MCKSRAYNEHGAYTAEQQNGALQTLHVCIDIVLKLLAPVTPIITAKLHQELRGKDIHTEDFPQPSADQNVPLNKETLIEVNSAVWKAKKDKGLSLKADVAELTVPLPLKLIEADLKAAHSAKKMSYGDQISVTFTRSSS